MAIQIKPHRVTIPCDHWVPSEVGKLITQFKIARVDKKLIDKLMIGKHTKDMYTPRKQVRKFAIYISFK